MRRHLVKLFLVLSLNVYSQSNLELNGYLQNMETVWATKDIKDWILSNSISNRINLIWYANKGLTFRSSLRNIFDYGQFVSLIPLYSKLTVVDNGYLNLTKKIISGNSYILYSNIDRLNITYNTENFEIQIGRQRINWGINAVWTPNDIFNSSSFINFDYAEKPGSDALRLQYYLSYASSVEIVSNLNKDKEFTIAGKLQLNRWDYDFQFLGGISKEDLIFGTGWAGNIAGAGFTGEFSYFHGRDKKIERNGLYVSSIGFNYTFSNSFYIASEFLYNSRGKVGKLERTSTVFDLDYSAKNLSPSRYSIFTQASYPITPLISASVAGIINPSDGSLFFSPTTEISLNEDVFLLISGQFFIGEQLTEWGRFGKFYYLRLKWNF